MKLNVKIWRRKNVVVAEIVEQVGIERESGQIVSSGNHCISSRQNPAISETSLYIRGYNEMRDQDTICHCFDSEENAIEWCTVIDKLITEINTKESILGDFICVR